MVLSMPVYMVKQMPSSELTNWIRYFNERPIGWREDRRASMIMAPHVQKFSPEKYFPSLDQMKRRHDEVRHDDKDQYALQPQQIKNNPFILYLRGVSGGKFLSFLDKEKEENGLSENKG